MAWEGLKERDLSRFDRRAIKLAYRRLGSREYALSITGPTPVPPGPSPGPPPGPDPVPPAPTPDPTPLPRSVSATGPRVWHDA